MASPLPTGICLWRTLGDLTRAPSTPPFVDRQGQPLPGSIATVYSPPIGGLPQRLVIRGAHPDTPLLLFVHGGPGATLSNAWFRRFNAELEEHFTVVTWDQRGTGRTQGPPASIITQYLQDLHEVVLWLRQRFQAQRVLLIGHSWGSALGLQYAAIHPEQLSGYVGIGQVVDMPGSEAQSYAWVSQEAQRRGHRSAQRALRRIGPPPYGHRQVLTQRKWLSLFGGDLYAPLGVKDLLREALRTPEFNALDLWFHLRGSLRSNRALWSAFGAVNLTTLRSFGVPLWFAQGRHDHVISGMALQAYVEEIQAPQVRVVWFEASGHAPHVEEHTRFNRWLNEEVFAQLPLPGCAHLDRHG